MTDSDQQNPATPDATPANPAQPAANSEPATATPAQPAATPRPSNENSAAKLLTDVHTAISALPEQIAKVLAEQNPKPVRQAAPATVTKQEPAKQEPATSPQKKTFSQWWFGQ